MGSEERPEAARFLRSFADAVTVTPGFGASALFLVGVDGYKDGAAVWRAYNDETEEQAIHLESSPSRKLDSWLRFFRLGGLVCSWGME